GLSWAWSVTGDASIIGPNINAAVQVQSGGSGSFVLTLNYVDQNGCTCSNSKNVSIATTPTCVINGQATVCANATATWNGPGAGLSWAWSVTGNATIVGSNSSASVQVQAGGSGTFVLTLNYTDQNGCVCSNSKNVIIATCFSQNINLPTGWFIFSTFINPQNPEISHVISSIQSLIIIIKDENGLVYWPAYEVNQIGNMITGKGYQIKLSAATTLTITGNQIDPESTPLSLNPGWGMLGYIRTSEGELVAMLNSINENIIIMKNSMGQVYWPLWSVNQIGIMIPGEGYQIKMSSACILIYPSD
ncbi:MAG: hypothetical protein NTW49_10320, partial [Bacteroidia bacterium]|nr:hypothetical protein [Bacteroidia bacterium]